MKITTGSKEIRQVTTQIELRSDGESNEIIEGYALKFDKWSDDLGWFREKLASESLEKTDMSNVTALFNHNESQILGEFNSNRINPIKPRRLSLYLKHYVSHFFSKLNIFSQERGMLTTSS